MRRPNDVSGLVLGFHTVNLFYRESGCKDYRLFRSGFAGNFYFWCFSRIFLAVRIESTEYCRFRVVSAWHHTFVFNLNQS